MKKTVFNFTLILLTFILLINTQSFSQVLISNSTGSPDASAMLEIKSTDKGLLIPRLTTAQRKAIDNGSGHPTKGLIVYDSDKGSFFMYGKTAKGTDGWIDLSTDAGIWTRNSNSVYLSNTAYNVGIGTETPKKKFVIRAQNATDTLFEIQDVEGNPLMVVTPKLTKFNIINTAKGTAGGFAVGRYALAKATKDTGTLFSVKPDSTRIYTGTAGGFAVGKYALAKGKANGDGWFFSTNADSTRVYTGTAGGFAVGKYALAKGKGTHTSYMYMVPDNYFIGDQSGEKLQTGSFTGKYNTFFGFQTGMNDMSGLRNVLLGYQAGLNISSGSDNVLLGYKAGHEVTTAGNNISIGSEAGYNNTNNSDNIFIGRQAGYNHVGTGTPNKANNNIYIGYNAGYGINGGQGKNNICIGTQSGDSITTGSFNVFLGYQTGRHTSDGNYNTFVGYQTGYQSEGDNNSFFGNKAGFNNTSGSGNTFVGNSSGASNNTGNNNSYFGDRAGWFNGSGKNNVAMGYYANGQTSANGGDDNVKIGFYSGARISGNNNTFIGSETGYSSSAISQDSCVFIGYASGHKFTDSQRLIIDNNGYTTNGYYKYPLIYGEFDNKLLRINGTLTINEAGNDFTFPDSRGSNGNVLISGGNGTTAWGVPSSTAISARNGLSMDGSYVEMGGSLVQNTNIFQGDYSMLYYLTGSGDFMIYNGSNYAFYVQDAAAGGNVGIGTSSPSEQLTVYKTGDVTTKIQTDDGNSANLSLYENTSGTDYGFNFEYDGSTDKLHLWSKGFSGNDYRRVTFLKEGKVGIGTTAPNELLEIGGTGRAFFGDGGGSDRKGLLIDGIETAGARLEAYNYSTGTGLDLIINTAGGGNVGIGTTSPNTKLDVSGTIRTTGGAWPAAGAGIEILYTGGIGYIQSYDRDGSAWKPLSIGASLVGIGTNSPAAKLDVRNSGTEDIFNLFDGSTEVMTVLDGGKVGIGTTAPNSRLHINSVAGENPLRVQINGSSKLIVASNGGTSIGAFATPPANGLYVIGNAGIGTTTPTEKLDVTGNINANQNAFCITLTAGEAITAGDVVVVSTSADLTVIHPLTDGNEHVVGVTVKDAANGSSVTIAVGGAVQVTVDGTVTRGDFLETSATTAGRVKSSGIAGGAGDFGIALQNGTDGTKIWMIFKKTEVY